MLRAALILFCLAAPPVAAESRVAAATPARLDAAPLYVMPADSGAADFVQSNLIFVFYHEIAHALIDILKLSVLGREEDAADTLSALLIDRLWDEGAAVTLVTDAALAFLLFSEEAERGGAELSNWGHHSLDLQRYYNLVCLFYGADPEGRSALAGDLGLPPPRRESCPEEYQLAADSWGAMLEGMPPQDHGPRFRLVVPSARDAYTVLIAEEIEALNGEYGLPVFVDVTVERCGEANAFYDPRARRVVMCIEYAEDLARLYAGRAAE
ncbi:MAG: DUF4344 domain-containing metallopeptidase [Gemmobacter sp.]